MHIFFHILSILKSTVTPKLPSTGCSCKLAVSTIYGHQHFQIGASYCKGNPRGKKKHCILNVLNGTENEVGWKNVHIDDSDSDIKQKPQIAKLQYDCQRRLYKAHKLSLKWVNTNQLVQTHSCQDHCLPATHLITNSGRSLPRSHYLLSLRLPTDFPEPYNYPSLATLVKILLTHDQGSTFSCSASLINPVLCDQQFPLVVWSRTLIIQKGIQQNQALLLKNFRNTLKPLSYFPFNVCTRVIYDKIHI